MGLLDQLAGSVLGQSGDSETQVPDGMLGAVMDLIKQQEGGVSGLIAKFQQGGLGDIVNSWIGKGDNMPISAEQIQSILGNEQIAAVASKLGIDTSAAASTLAQFLPMIIDKLSPSGELEGGDSLVSAGINALKGKLFG